MNERAVAYAIKHSPCSGGPFIVHVAMAYHAGRDGVIVASTGEVAATARMTPNAVRRAQAHLVAEGVIEQVSESVGPRSAGYRLARIQRRAKARTDGALTVAEARTSDAVAATKARRSGAVAAVAPSLLGNSLSNNTQTLETTDGDAVELIFAAWREATGHHRAVLDAKRRGVIVKARKLYPDDDLHAAVRGVTLSAHNMGQTNGHRYDDIALVLRDAAHIERFRDLWLRRDERPDPRQHKVVGGLARALDRAR